MTRDEADRLLARSREGYESLAAEREQLGDAVVFLVREGRSEDAAELAWNAWRLWMNAGDVRGGRALLTVVIDRGDGRPTGARARVLYADGVLAFRAGVQDESRARNEEALELARTIGDPEAESLALVGLSRVAFRDGDYARVRALARQARELVRDLGPAADAAPLHLLAAGTRLGGDYDDSVRLYGESLELNRRLGNRPAVAMELHNLGHVELHRGNIDIAARHFAECAPLRDPQDPVDRAMAQLNEAALAYTRGERERALDLLTKTERTLDDAGIKLDPDDAFEVSWLRERL